MTRLMREIARAGTAVQFLTRLPVPDPGWEEGRLGASLGWFGAVGAGIGAVAAGGWLLAGLVLPAPVAAGLALALMLMLTGALHEDGLADLADGLGGAAARARALEIMRDSRIGSYGAAALIVVLGLRWAALATMAPAEGALALVLAAAAGRALIVPAAALTPYARASGLGAGLGARASPLRLAAALAVPFGVAAASGWAAMLALGLGAGAAALVLGWQVARLGGHTGDGLGAVAAVAETAVLIALAGGDA